MRTTLSQAERDGIARSRLFLCFVTPQWLTDPHAQAMAAYAQRLDKPFRVLVWPGVRLPEDAFRGVTNLAIALRTTQAGDMAQIERWLEEYR
jgi:hypothetical protein